jgi:hypothetical protein
MERVKLSGRTMGSIRSFVYEGSVKVDIPFVGQLADPGKRAPN